MASRGVNLGAGDRQPGLLEGAVTRTPVDTVEGALALAQVLGRILLAAPTDLADQWTALATLGAANLECARAIEPHLDALSILKEAGESTGVAIDAHATWGVFAAEGPDARLTATRDGDGDGDGDGWTLTGVKPWCSLADRLDAALTTAWVDADHRALFAASLRDGGVEVDTSAWHSRGLAGIPSGPVRFSSVAAQPVGAPGWYLTRPGFAWGGIGVAACWYGGAVGIARRVWQGAAEARDRPRLDAHLGAIDEVLTAAGGALASAADSISAGLVAPGDEGLLAARVRGIVVRACEEVIWRAGHALGPAPLALEADYAQRVADLSMYIRQHHAEGDQESLGRTLSSRDVAPW